MLLYILIILLLLLCLLHNLMNNNSKARRLRTIPGPKYHFLIGNAWHILLPPVELFNLVREFATKFNGIYRFYAYPHASVNIYNPEDIEIVLSSMKHHEKSEVYKFMRPWLRDGLLMSSGHKWQQRRKILTSAFHFNVLRQYFVVLNENAVRLVQTLEKTMGESTDVFPVISEYTLNSICESAMGTKLDAESSTAGVAYKNAIHNIGKLLFDRFIRMYLYSDFVFNRTWRGKQQNKILSIIRNFTEDVIKKRKANVNYDEVLIPEETNNSDDLYINGNKTKNKTAMLDLLIAAEKNRLIDEVGIQEEVDTFMFEGHDTTAAGLALFLMILANNPTAQDKVVLELQEIFGNTTREPTMEDFNKMVYLERCIKESLRLYPPVPFISRRLCESVKLRVDHIFVVPVALCLFHTISTFMYSFILLLTVNFDEGKHRDDTAYLRMVLEGNYTVPEGTFCHVHIYDLHRRPDIFPDPLKFDPDRFLPANSAGRHNFAYIPFSAGPRNCIGQKFAMMEMKSALSSVLRNFELQPVTTPANVQFKADVILRSDHPIYVKFIKRI